MAKLLIVDDERTSRMRLAHVSKSLGYATVQASDGTRALTVLEDNPDIVCIVTDCQMPNLDGPEFISRVRASGCKLPILVYSSYRSIKEVSMLLDMGADAFLSYPISRENFGEYLERYLFQETQLKGDSMKLIIPAGDLETYQGFINESGEHLDGIEKKVLGLADAMNGGTVNSLFRALHTITGIAGFLNLTDIQHLSHRLESIFDAIRQGSLLVDSKLVNVSLANIAHLMAMIKNLSEGISHRIPSPEGGFAVEMVDVDYQASYAELGYMLDPKSATDPVRATQSIEAVSEAPSRATNRKID